MNTIMTNLSLMACMMIAGVMTDYLDPLTAVFCWILLALATIIRHNSGIPKILPTFSFCCLCSFGFAIFCDTKLFPTNIVNWNYNIYWSCLIGATFSFMCFGGECIINSLDVVTRNNTDFYSFWGFSRPVQLQTVCYRPEPTYEGNPPPSSWTSRCPECYVHLDDEATECWNCGYSDNEEEQDNTGTIPKNDRN